MVGQTCASVFGDLVQGQKGNKIKNHFLHVQAGGEVELCPLNRRGSCREGGRATPGDAAMCPLHLARGTVDSEKGARRGQKHWWPQLLGLYIIDPGFKTRSGPKGRFSLEPGYGPDIYTSGP